MCYVIQSFVYLCDNRNKNSDNRNKNKAKTITIAQNRCYLLLSSWIGRGSVLGVVLMWPGCKLQRIQLTHSGGKEVGRQWKWSGSPMENMVTKCTTFLFIHSTKWEWMLQCLLFKIWKQKINCMAHILNNLKHTWKW